MKPKAYDLLSRCIDEGIQAGIRRYFKYKYASDKNADGSARPEEEVFRENQMLSSIEADMIHDYDTISNVVMSEVCEWFDFEDNAR